MDAASLFQSLTSKPEAPASNIITGTAVGASEDGMVLVQVDGSAVAQPSDEEVSLTIPTDEFAGGSYQLPSAPYPGTIVLKDSTDAIVDEDDYYVDGDQLTIEALDLPPVEIAYDTEVRQALTNDDFASGSITVDSTTNLALLEDMGGADWQPAAYTLDGNELTVAGIETQQGLVEFVYVRSVSLVCEVGLNVLPDMPDPDDVAVTGRLNNTDYVVTSWTLDQDQLTLPSGYDAFVVDYIINETEQWNINEQYLDEPLQDSDEAADPTVITVGHDLQYEPDTVTSCTVDGVAATYTLDGVNVVADSPAVTERYFTLTYDTPVTLEVPASEFAVSSYTLPSEPTGAVTTTSNGSTLANSVSGLELSIPSLIATSASYTIAYTAQVESDVVELPCTPAVSEGQFVDIAIVNGMPSVIGASGSGDATMAAAAAAESAATAAEAVANAVNQHFWQRSTNPDGAGAGVFITEVTQEDFTDPASPNYQSGANQLSNSQGILLRDGLANFAQLTPGETAFYDGNGNGANNVVASLGSSGSIIGKANESHAYIDYHSIQMVDKEGTAYFHVSDLRDHSGYAPTYDEFVGDGVTTQFKVTLIPHNDATSSVEVNGTPVAFTRSMQTFTLGAAPADGASVVISYETPSADAKAYTLGIRDAGAVGPMSLAEGYSTVASGFCAHSEGIWSVASLQGSHAQNIGTIAAGPIQTAMGRWNVSDTTSALIIGNGTANNARSNALVVGWNGDVTAAGTATLGTPLAVASGGTGADNATDAASNLRAVRYASGQAAQFQNYAGTAHQWGISAECVNANNASYYGKRTGLIVRNDGFSLYDPSTSSTIWQLDATPTEQVVQLTNATATTFSVRKAQPMCTLYVQQLNVTSALASGANVSIGTIPSGYRPPHPITVPLSCNNNNSGKGVYLYITTAGAVSIYNRSGASMATNVNLYGCCTYVL